MSGAVLWKDVEQACAVAHRNRAAGRQAASPELADIFRTFGESYRARYPVDEQQRKAMHLIQRCRTAYLGGHLYRCDECGSEVPVYNSCRNRHCPKCQTLAKEQWLADRKSELLPVGYYHNVFTLPHDFNPLVACNKKLMLDMLFEAVNYTLQAFAHDPQWRLKGELGFLAILHTWSQQLIDHYHLHCVIPAGVLRADGSWRSARSEYLFKTSSLADCFRNQYCRLLEKAYRKGRLAFDGRAEALSEPSAFGDLLTRMRGIRWIAYSKQPFAGPEQVLEYLGRYTHRVAIGNHRILSVQNEQVTFTWRQRKEPDPDKQIQHMTLPVHEFIRRFLLHVLPEGFHKIRHFGFLSNRYRTANIQRIRAQLDRDPPAPAAEESLEEIMLRLTGKDITRCPHCGKGQLIHQCELFALWKLPYLDSS